MISLKMHHSYREVIAICDADLIGRKFEQGKFQLDIKEVFYKGEEKTKKELIPIIKNWAGEDATFNIVGKESVNCALEAGIAAKEDIKKISNIPFVLVLL